MYGSTPAWTPEGRTIGCAKAVDVNSAGEGYVLTCEGEILKRQDDNTYVVHSTDSKVATDIAVGVALDDLWIVDSSY